MHSLDFLYYALGVGFLTLTGFLCYMIYHLTESLKEVEIMLKNVRGITEDASLLKEQIKLWGLKLISGFLSRGGDKNGKRKRR